MELITVEDPADPLVADYVGLTDADLRRRVEGPGGFFVAEGVLVIRQLVASPYSVRSVLVTPKKLAVLQAELEALDAPVYVAGQAVLNAIAGFNIHRGALAAADRRPLPDPASLLTSASLVAVLEGLNDHENLGSLFRNAAAFGVDAVLLSPTCADPLYRRSVRVSMGHVLRIPFSRLDPWPDALSVLRAGGFEVLALTPDPSADPIDARMVAGHDFESPPPSRSAVLLGAEGPGLTAAAMAAADRRVRIPMAKGVDSLNVATAAAIAFHHLARV